MDFGNLNFGTLNTKTEEKQLDLSNPSEHHRLVIIGSGPAGYTAGIYAARANLNPVIYTGLEVGGQLTTTTTVENYPGYPDGIEGPTMMEDFKRQAEKFGADIRFGEITRVDFGKRPFILVVDEEKVISADAVIIATGATAKYLGLESEQRLRGAGVSACATCDGFFFKDKIVAVVGGGDTACEEALYLAGLAKKVYMLVRKPYMRASKIMQKRVLEHPKIEVLFEHETLELIGEKKVEGVKVVFRRGKPDEKIYTIPIDGFFLAIGHKPNSDVFKPWIETDEKGFIITKCKSTKTNIEGVFAAGDVQDPIYRQAVTAAATGAMAAKDAENYLQQLEQIENQEKNLEQI